MPKKFSFQDVVGNGDDHGEDNEKETHNFVGGSGKGGGR